MGNGETKNSDLGRKYQLKYVTWLKENEIIETIGPVYNILSGAEDYSIISKHNKWNNDLAKYCNQKDSLVHAFWSCTIERPWRIIIIVVFF